MLTWLEQAGKGRAAHYDGAYASLVRFYETHPDSPYHELHPNTQRTYSNTLKLLMEHKGKRLVRQTDTPTCDAGTKSYATATRLAGPTTPSTCSNRSCPLALPSASPNVGSSALSSARPSSGPASAASAS